MKIPAELTFTDQIDQLVREIYLESPRSEYGLPYPATGQEGRRATLCAEEASPGTRLALTKELPWSEPELAILSRCAWMSDERIHLKLKAAGFTVA